MEPENDNTIIARLKQFIEYTALSNSQFADKAGIPRPTLSQLIHGRNKSVNDLLLRKLHESFPELNVSWLLFGLGEMLETSNIQFSASKVTTKSEADEVQSSKKETVEPSFIPANPVSKSDSICGETLQGSLFDTIASAKSRENDAESPDSPAFSSDKKIKSIIVLYTDSSFEIFSPDRNF